jgi:hypothetical protein
LTGTTAELGLATATDSDDIEAFLATNLTADLNALDALFSFTTGHDHSGPHKGKGVTLLSAPHLSSVVIDSGGIRMTGGLLFKNDGAPLQIGTLDGQSLQLITNNLGRLTIDLNGTVTVAQNLAVNGSTALTGGLAGNLLRTGGPLLVGTTDAQSVQLQTNGLGRLTIDLNGQATFAQNLIVTGTTFFTGGISSALYRAPGASFLVGTTDGQSLQLQTNSTSRITIDANGVTTINNVLITSPSVVGAAGFNLPHGTAPTSPVNGDMWSTTAGLFIRVNGVTKSVNLT